MKSPYHLALHVVYLVLFFLKRLCWICKAGIKYNSSLDSIRSILWRIVFIICTTYMTFLFMIIGRKTSSSKLTKPNQTCASKQRAVSKLSLVCLSLLLLAYLEMKGPVKLMDLSSFRHNAWWRAKKKFDRVLWKQEHFKCVNFSLSTSCSSTKNTLIFLVFHTSACTTYGKDTHKKVPKEAMNNSLEPLKYIPKFSIIPASNSSFSFPAFAMLY